MRSVFSIAVAGLSLTSSLVSAAPVAKRDGFPGGAVFPLADGFPTPNTDQLNTIQKQAFGTLPNGPPPATISTDGLTNLKLIALNEVFEVAFFTELVYNLTNKLPGYDLDYAHDFVTDTLKAVIAQEELHALNANGALAHFNAAPIQPCKYNFPVSKFQDAISLAATFTDVVLGTLQDVNQIFAKNGDDGLVRGVSSVIGQEGEQEGFYHVLQNKRPNTLPFLTTSVRDFAFTAIQSFTIPGSCPNINTIPLKTFQPLNILSTPTATTGQLKFSFQASKAGTTDYANKLSLVYINQQNLPVVEKLQDVVVSGDVVTFDALFPYDQFEMNGLTIAAVVNGAGPFANADAVAQAAVFGPGLIEI
ncbi:late sexual development protein [Lepidopterella palustris CBS 459.81]|uniref:Late sexual development protein n=1 Tax=Lepidopterella palustris CBS 459.81 TaxID=1314670 RepID=A0A8E2JGB2_9PEZI|nr:late sexual development protein [Lepidopterella palustris CBS 459.81]